MSKLWRLNSGLYGFSTATPIPLFPSLKLHYWHAVLDVLRDTLGCKVMVVGVKGTGSIEERAQQMHSYLEKNLPKGTGVNFVAHSMVSTFVIHLDRNLVLIPWCDLQGWPGLSIRDHASKADNV
jgi:hypothetical protein